MKYPINSAEEARKIANRIGSATFKKPYVIDVDFADGRTNEQNRLMWACLTDISQQVEWHGEKHSPEMWKDILTAAIKRQRLVPGVDGGFVAIGAHTSKMSKAELSELVDLIYFFGTDNGVEFKEQKQ